MNRLSLLACLVAITITNLSAGSYATIIGQQLYLKYHVLTLKGNTTKIYRQKIAYTDECISNENIGDFYNNIQGLVFRGECVRIDKYELNKEFVRIFFDYKGKEHVVWISRQGDFDTLFQSIFSKKPIIYDFNKVVTRDFFNKNIKSKADLLRWFGYPISICKKGKKYLFYYNTTFLGKEFGEYNDFWLEIEENSIVGETGIL
jgi:hypothetical protein